MVIYTLQVGLLASLQYDKAQTKVSSIYSNYTDVFFSDLDI